MYFFIVYGTNYCFGVSQETKILNKVIRNEHPIEWIARQKSHVLINWWEIPKDLYNKYIEETQLYEHRL